MTVEEFRNAVAKTGRKKDSEITRQLVEIAKIIGEKETLILLGFMDAMMGRC